MDALERWRTLKGDLERIRTGRWWDGHGHGTKKLTPLYHDQNTYLSLDPNIEVLLTFKGDY